MGSHGLGPPDSGAISINMALTGYGHILNINRRDEGFTGLRSFPQKGPVEKMSVRTPQKGTFLLQIQRDVIFERQRSAQPYS
ncbi:hypothetical protein AA103581_0638 [Gluconobacter wancherniae NBRC 103581]|nr:hypothetical protein AA103581_0638 [Gluconobacter wancherniae NBRC 103581]